MAQKFTIQLLGLQHAKQIKMVFDMNIINTDEIINKLLYVNLP